MGGAEAGGGGRCDLSMYIYPPAFTLSWCSVVIVRVVGGNGTLRDKTLIKPSVVIKGSFLWLFCLVINKYVFHLNLLCSSSRGGEMLESYIQQLQKVSLQII